MPGKAAIPNASWDQIRTVLADPTVRVGLYGPPGVGKTHALFTMARSTPPPPSPKTGRKLSLVSPLVPTRYVGKVQFHAELAPAEVMGMHVPDGSTFRWEPGPGDLAYARGGLLILDEIDQASGPMKTYLLGLLDSGPGGTISYVGRTFEQQPGYQPVATMNDRPDDGALPEAVLDRFDAWFFVPAPSQEQLQLLDPDLRIMCGDAYESAADPLRGPDITFRILLGFQRMRKRMPREQAALGACYNNGTLAHSFLEVLKMVDPDEIADVVKQDTEREKDGSNE